MSPPKHSSWAKRYIQTSAELNRILCGVPHKDSSWTSQDVSEFNSYMKKHSKALSKSITLYRGTSVPSPIMSPLEDMLVNCQYMSTTKSRDIAEEFNWRKKGYIHILHCQRGVRVYDFENDYGDDPVKREQEVLILPGHVLTIINKDAHTITWKVSKHK